MAMKQFDIISAKEAAGILSAHGLKVSPESVRAGIRAKQFPFGVWIPQYRNPDKVAMCPVFRNKLDEWIDEYASGEG